MKGNNKKEKSEEQNSAKSVQVEPAQTELTHGEFEEGKYGEVEEYHFSGIQVYHGIINKWLLLVYLVLGLWAIFYIFKYWGGLGPGLEF